MNRVRLLCAIFASGLAAASSGAAALADFPPYARVVGLALVAPLSGDDRDYGIQLSDGMQLAIDDANERRGLTDFGWVLHTFDDQNDPGVAQQQAEFSLVDEGTSVVVGHVGAEPTLLSLPTYAQKGAPLIIPTNPLGQLTQRGYDDIFRLCPPDSAEGQQDARYAERTLKAKRAAVVYQENDIGANTAQGFIQFATAGKDLTAKDFGVDPDVKDPAALVATIKAFAPDLIYAAGDGRALSKTILALRAAGVDAPLFANQGFWSDPAMKAIGASAQGSLVSSCVPPIELMPTAQLFLMHYRARFGRPTAFSLFGYVAAQVAIAAATQIHSADRRSIARQLSIGSFQTVLGLLSFQRNGDPAQPILYLYRYGPDNAFKYVDSTFPNPLIAR